MALIIEDGTRKPDAQSYADVATVDAYCAARGYSDWTGTNAIKEAAILRAMVYIDGLCWRGLKASEDQALEWPRGWVEDKNGYAVSAYVVPSQVVHALCEAALRELQSAGWTLPDMGRDDMLNSMEISGAVKLSWSASAPNRTDITIVKTILRGLIKPSGGARLQL